MQTGNAGTLKYHPFKHAHSYQQTGIGTPAGGNDDMCMSMSMSMYTTSHSVNDKLIDKLSIHYREEQIDRWQLMCIKTGQ